MLEYFVFTDAKSLYAESNPDVHKIHQENLGWPYNTLKRFEMFLRVEDALKEFDFVFFFNANCLFFQHVGEEFLPIEKDLLVVQHSGFIDIAREHFTYERNPESLACIALNEGKHYVQGSINGGKTKAFLTLARTLYERIEDDISRGIIAIWHDESHLNRYIIDNPNYKLMHYGYNFPEGSWHVPSGGVYIILRDKSKTIDVNAIKGINIDNKHISKAQRFNNKIKHLLKRYIRRK